MSDLAHNAPQEFWRPPKAEPVALEPSVHPRMVEACARCETEFLSGAEFCHRCGAERTAVSSRGRNWTGHLRNFLRHLEFQHIESWTDRVRHRLGLSTGALISFLIGLICVAGAIGIGIIFTVQTTLDWQAVQLWRIEWLLGALVAFVAGILLKKAAS